MSARECWGMKLRVYEVRADEQVAALQEAADLLRQLNAPLYSIHSETVIDPDGVYYLVYLTVDAD